VDQIEDRGIGFKADSRACTSIGVKNVYDLERCVIFSRCLYMYTFKN